MTKQELKDMKLHEAYLLSSSNGRGMKGYDTILRVASGWIYSSYVIFNNKNGTSTSVFVPEK